MATGIVILSPKPYVTILQTVLMAFKRRNGVSSYLILALRYVSLPYLVVWRI